MRLSCRIEKMPGYRRIRETVLKWPLYARQACVAPYSDRVVVKIRRLLLTAALVCCFWVETPFAEAAKPLMVHYMPWFVSQPYSGSWGWHWTMNHFNPNVTDPNGRKDIASWYYPLIGPYDSLDPAVLEYHVLLMKLAGIDGVIVDWYGMDNYNDQ